MSQTSKILVVASFQDPNQPKINVEVDTIEEARTEVSIIANRYAALRTIWVYEEKTSHIFDGRGNYLFTATRMSGIEEDE